MRTGDESLSPGRADDLSPLGHADFADALPQLAWLARPDGYIYWFNRRWYDYTGTTLPIVRGSGWQSLVDPLVLPEVRERWRVSIARGQPFEMEIALGGADRKFRTFLAQTAPVRGPTGEIVRWIGTHTDISGQHEAREALRISEANLRGTFENAAVGIAHIAADGSFLRVNQTLCAITGYAREELLTKSFAEITHPDDLESDCHQVRRLAAGEISTYAMEKRYQRKDGAFVWINLTGSAIRDESGTLLHFIAVVEDITRRKAGELAANETNRRFRLISRATNDLLWDLDLTTGARWSSLATALDAGGSEDSEEISHRAWTETIHPDDRDQITSDLQSHLDGDHQQWRGEYRIRRANGDYALVSDRAFIIRDEAGVALRMVGAMLDITDRKRAEEHLRESESALRHALEAAALVAFVWDIQRNEMRRHRNADELMGSTPEKTDTLETVRLQVHPDDRANFDARMQAAFQDPAGLYSSDFRLVGKSGEIRWLQESGRVEFNRDGKPVRLVGLSQDITARKVSEIKLLEAQRELQEHAGQLEAAVAERTARLQDVITELDGFSHSIAHDLRTPLRSIRNFSDILVEEYSAELSDDARSCLMRIARASGKMDTMIHDVLEYSRISRDDLQLETVAPGEILGDLIAAYPNFDLPAASVTIAGPLPEVKASRSALTQCFSNLLNNAVKFVAPGVTPQIRVRAESNEGNVRLWFEDNGIGIAPESQEKIWGMLERLHSSYDGVGVGLSIVRKAVERMRGTVGVRSEVGRGSQFWIELPRAG